MSVHRPAGVPAPFGAVPDAHGTTVTVYAPDVAELRVIVPGHGPAREVGLSPVGEGVWTGPVPGLHVGGRYGLRAEGRNGQHDGHFVDSAKLLADPYARAFDGTERWGEQFVHPGASTVGLLPWAVVTDRTDMPEHPRPRFAWSDAVVYEAHVRGFSMTNPAVPHELRGTFAGLAHPASIDHLLGLGVNTVELLPVAQFFTEPRLARRGLRNHWGYNTFGWHAPHAGYAATGTRGEQVAEFRDLVRALHAAGIAVVLDVVYNHSAESDASGPTLSLRALGDRAYYRHVGGTYENVTGCGNTLDLRHPRVLQLVTDSLRCWVSEFGVDGFRFDLATSLARGDDGFDPAAAFFACLAQDPVLASAWLIAEPWDVGPGGYRLGSFPAGWAEWNARFRDDVRDVWRGHGQRPALARALAGSSEVFRSRSPAASVNFTTAHDGFTLADLVCYDEKHNAANLEDGRDGEAHNRSWNGGAEGPTDDPAILANRTARRRALLATTLLSLGVPMLRAGDELGHTQQGNNNAYCQDNALSWLDWSQSSDPAGHDRALPALIAALCALRDRFPVLRRRAFLGAADVRWLGPDGRELDEAGWHTPLPTLGVLFPGPPSLLTWWHATGEPARARLPEGSYDVLLDTARLDPLSPPAQVSGEVELGAWSVLVLTGATVPA